MAGCKTGVPRMKKLIFSAAALLLAGVSFASVTVRYDNKDDKGYLMTVKIDGEYKEVKIESNKSALLTIKGGNNACVFVTGCGEVEVNDGDIITVKDRCITVYHSMQQNYYNWSKY